MAGGEGAGRITPLLAGAVAPGLAVVLALAAALSGCSGREHTNPFDPANPDTGGEPRALRTAATCSAVELSWTDLGLEDVRGFRLWREVLGPQPTGPIELTANPLPAAARGYRDATALNGEPYAYTLEFLFTRGSSAPARPARARPGPALPWIADPCGYGLTQLDPDGRTVRHRVDVGAAVLDLVIDPAAHRLYAAEIDLGRVRIASTIDGSLVGEIDAPGASCVDWDAAMQVLAVGAFYEQRLDWLSVSGGTVATLALDGHPEDVALRDSSTTWVALYEGPLLRASWTAASNAHAEVACAALQRAVRVLDDPEGAGCWVADRAGGQVAYVPDLGAIAFTPAGLLAEPMDLAPASAGCCWVADRRGRGIVRLDRLCQLVERRGDIAHAACVREDPESGALWVSVPDAGEVWRLDPDGENQRLALAGCPRRIAGDWTGGCAR